MGSDELAQLDKVQVTSWVLLLVICLVSYVFTSWEFTWSVFAGGVISILSFQVAHKDVLGFIDSLANTPDDGIDEQKQKALKQGKIGFIVRFWIRIAIIGVVLLLLIKSGRINIFGLILGLSTIVLTVTFTTLNVARHYFIRRR